MKQAKHAIKLLTGLVALVSVLALTACEEKQQATTPERSEVEKETIVWKLAQTWGTGFPIFGDAVIRMADMVKVMSNGELEIRIDSANKHKAAFGVLDMVNAGQYEMGHSASYYWKGKDANTMFFTTMPLWHDRPGTVRLVLLRWRYGVDEKDLRQARRLRLSRWQYG